jgi:riboflavin kinase/FMN adenylyltransferase
MRVYRGSEAIAAADRGCVITIGNFDGVHLGHQVLLKAVVERARALGGAAAVYTFHPHPRRVLYPEQSDRLLMTWDQLESELEQRDVEILVREPFTLDFAALDAEAFLRDIIFDRIAPKEIFVGRDFHFGKGRAGGGDTLAELGPRLGIRVSILPQVRAGGIDVSSTRIRAVLAAGEVEEAAQCLGRPYAIRGRVVEGERRGRLLGFPTANLQPENEIVPGKGVYATSVRIFAGDRPGARIHPSVTNIGTRPTFEPGEVLTEAHLLDFDDDLYGARIELRFHARIRDERRFATPQELANQIERDTAEARRIHARRGVK